MERSVPELNFPSRPSRSKNLVVKNIDLYSNHFPVKFNQNKQYVFVYSIQIFETSKTEKEKIPEDDRGLFREITSSIRSQYKDKYGKNAVISGFNMWSREKIDEKIAFETKIGDRVFSILVEPSKEIDLQSKELLKRNACASVRQYVNVLIKNYQKDNGYIEWGQNSKFYNHDKTYKLKDIEIWVGFKNSCENYERGAFKVVMDYSVRIVRNETVYDFIMQLINDKMSKEDIKNELRGKSMICNYGNNKMWKIYDVDFGGSPESLYIEGDSKTSLKTYYKSKYNIDLKDPKQPILIYKNMRSQKVIHFVPELMRMTGLTEQLRKDNNQMKQFTKFTKLDPKERMKIILAEELKFSNYFKQNTPITISSENKIQEILLDQPQIGIAKSSVEVQNGLFSIKDILYRPAKIEHWILAYPKVIQDKIKNFTDLLSKASAKLGVNYMSPKECPISSRESADLIKALKKLTEDNPKIQIIVLLIPDKAKEKWYPAIKRWASCEAGKLTQVVMLESIEDEKKKISVAQKITIQISAKTGNQPWVIKKIPEVPDGTMIIGADVYHKFGSQNQSVLGFCSSIDPTFTRFFNKGTFQPSGQELMLRLGKLVREACFKYLEANEKVPEYIIFFRDGVADNQLNAVLEIETRAILEELTILAGEENRPKFAHFVLTKKIDDRFFIKNHQGEFENPPSGTLVANQIISDNFDFYLIPQKVTSGTATATRYFCVYNDTNLNEEVFWKLAYSQCFNYYNWNGGIRVPAPVFYAHKIAYQIGEVLKAEIHENLELLPSYL